MSDSFAFSGIILAPTIHFSCLSVCRKKWSYDFRLALLFFRSIFNCLVVQQPRHKITEVKVCGQHPSLMAVLKQIYKESPSWAHVCVCMCVCVCVCVCVVILLASSQTFCRTLHSAICLCVIAEDVLIFTRLQICLTTWPWIAKHVHFDKQMVFGVRFPNKHPSSWGTQTLSRSLINISPYLYKIKFPLLYWSCIWGR